jgi:hypothetical protein
MQSIMPAKEKTKNGSQLKMEKKKNNVININVEELELDDSRSNWKPVSK